MSAHVLLNLLNDLGKRVFYLFFEHFISFSQRAFYVFFATSLINSIILEHEF